MAKRARGHRANKPNDSFGTVNNDTLYKGKYREEVYVDEDENEEQDAAGEADPDEQSATQQQAGDSFVEAKADEESHDYKKRYDDLKRHYDAKVNEFKQEIDALRENMKAAPQASQRIEMPKTEEELIEFRDKYPEMFEVVQTVSAIQARQQVSELEKEIGVIREREKEAEKKGAYSELLRLHPDFDELKTSEDFIDWLEEQPESLSDGIYKNNTNATLAARVIDLYKADKGISKKKSTKSARNDAAASVTRQAPKELSTAKSSSGKIWKASEIGKMKPWEFEKAEAELDAARAEGRIDYNS
jgi:hypothetical protein